MTEFRFSGTDVKAWPAVTDGEAIVANRWAESHLPITSVDEANHVIHFGKRSVFVLDPGDLYWIENVQGASDRCPASSMRSRARRPFT